MKEKLQMGVTFPAMLLMLRSKKKLPSDAELVSVEVDSMGLVRFMMRATKPAGAPDIIESRRRYQRSF